MGSTAHPNPNPNDPPGYPPPPQPQPATAPAPATASAWKRLLSSPWFVTAYSSFGGALLSEAYEAFEAGHLTFTAQSVHAMLVTALGATITALYHLYRPRPAKGN